MSTEKQLTTFESGLKDCISVDNLTAYGNSIDTTEKLLTKFCHNTDVYSKLSTVDRVKYDLFLAYAVSSLHWAYLKNLGRCPIKNQIKVQLDKIKECSDRLKMYEERDQRPRVDKAVLKRVIRHELWQNDVESSSKKIKFDENTDE